MFQNNPCFIGGKTEVQGKGVLVQGRTMSGKVRHSDPKPYLLCQQQNSESTRGTHFLQKRQVTKI